MNIKNTVRFHDFLREMLKKNKLTPSVLEEIMGPRETNRILDNADNEMGHPVMGTGGATILTGELTQSLNQIPDMKSHNSREKNQEHLKQMHPLNTINPANK